MPDIESTSPTIEVAKNTLYDTYEDFRGDVAHLVEKYLGHGYTNTIDHESFISNGAQSAVFLFEKDGEKYVTKIPRGSGQSQEGRGSDIEAHARVRGIPHLEQYVAASSEGIMIAEYVSGANLFEITASDLRQITDDQINQFVHTIIETHSLGIGIDPKPGNIIYNPENGFTIIDFGLIDNTGEEYKESPAAALEWSARSLKEAGLGDSDKGEYTNVDTNIELSKAKLSPLEMYSLAVQYQLDPKYHDKVLPKIENIIADLRYQADADAYKRGVEVSKRVVEGYGQNAQKYNPAIHGTTDDIF